MRYFPVSAGVADYLIRNDLRETDPSGYYSMVCTRLRAAAEKIMRDMRTNGGEYCLRNGDKILYTRRPGANSSWNIFSYTA